MARTGEGLFMGNPGAILVPLRCDAKIREQSRKARNGGEGVHHQPLVNVWGKILLYRRRTWRTHPIQLSAGELIELVHGKPVDDRP